MHLQNRFYTDCTQYIFSYIYAIEHKPVNYYTWYTVTGNCLPLTMMEYHRFVPSGVIASIGATTT